MPLSLLQAPTFLFSLPEKQHLLGFAVRLVLAAVRAKLLQFQTFGRGSLVLCFAVIPVFTFAALELNNFARHSLILYSKIFVTVPAPA
jgi:hypothetical protein